jgi:predicted DNA-binding transcriptional regulator YafY
MTFSVGDVDEVIRWAFGFGTEARIVGPQTAVERARELTRAMYDAYAL